MFFPILSSRSFLVFILIHFKLNFMYEEGIKVHFSTTDYTVVLASFAEGLSFLQ